MEQEEKDSWEIDELFLRRAADRKASSKILKDEKHYDDA